VGPPLYLSARRASAAPKRMPVYLGLRQGFHRGYLGKVVRVGKKIERQIYDRSLIFASLILSENKLSCHHSPD